MKYDEQSQFPLKTDDLVFFQDIKSSEVSEQNAYNQLIALRDYDTANQLMDSSSMHGYVASLFNMIQNRIYNTQAYLKQKANSAPLEVHSKYEPINPTRNLIWIGYGDIEDYIVTEPQQYRTGFRLGESEGNIKL